MSKDNPLAIPPLPPVAVVDVTEAWDRRANQRLVEALREQLAIPERLFFNLPPRAYHKGLPTRKKKP